MNWSQLDYPKAALKLRAETQWEAGFRCHACAKEPWTVAWIEDAAQRHPGAVLWDIGASTGPYTLIGAANGLRVVAFEPAPASYAALVDNVIANGLLAGRIMPLPVALTTRSGVAQMDLASLEAGAGSHSFDGLDAGKHRVARISALALNATTAVNILGVPRPAYIKLDVDGAEALVLGGFASFEGVVEIMTELPRDPSRSGPAVALLTRHGFEETARYEERGGKPIEGIYYAIWRSTGG